MLRPLKGQKGIIFGAKIQIHFYFQPTNKKDNEGYDIPDTVTYSEMEFVDCTENSQSLEDPKGDKNQAKIIPDGEIHQISVKVLPKGVVPTVPQPAGQPAGQPAVPQPIGKLAFQNASGIYARRNMIVDGSFNAKM